MEPSSNSSNISEAILASHSDTAAAVLAGIAVAAQVHSTPSGHPYVFNPITGKTESLEHLLARPLRQKTQRQIGRVEDFIAYVNRFKRPESSIYLSGLTYRAEIDHREARDAASAESLTWGDHVATLVMERSEGLKRWLEAQGKGLSQEQFAELLEERNMDIAVPTAAEMLEIVQDLHVTKNSAVTRAVRSNGKHSITFSEATDAKGSNAVDLPTTFSIRVQAFARQEITVELTALLRVRLRDSQPTFVFQFLRLEENLDEAIRAISDRITTGTALPLYV